MPGSQTEARMWSLVRSQQAHPVTDGGRAFLHQLHVPFGSLQISRELRGSVTTPCGEQTTDMHCKCWGADTKAGGAKDGGEISNNRV